MKTYNFNVIDIPYHIFFLQVDDDMNDLVGSFPGPPDTPYAGGKFWLSTVAVRFADP